VGVDALPAAIWAAYSRTVFGLMSGYRESWNSPAPPLPLIMARRDISGTALMSNGADSYAKADGLGADLRALRADG